MISLILLSATCNTIGAYINKILIAKGINRRDYFFYMCFSMLPFALAMMLFEKQKFEFSLIPLLLLATAAVIRYYSQRSVVGMMRSLEPYQYQSWVTLTIILTFVIDSFLGSQQFSLTNLASIVFTLSGILILTGFRLPEKSFRKDATIRIFCGIAQGYVTFFILKYWSNALYIFLLNLFLTIAFAKQYTFDYHKSQKNILKWVFLQQSFGFIVLYSTNFLTSFSVTLGIYVTPTAIILSILSAAILKDKKRRPQLKDFPAVLLVILGLVLLQK